MQTDKGLRTLALGIFAQAVSDRNSAIQYFVRSEAVQVREAYKVVLGRKLQNIKEAGGDISFNRKELLERTREVVQRKRQEARQTILETTDFLVHPSLWHEVLGVHPDSIRKRIEESDIDLRGVSLSAGHRTTAQEQVAG